MMAGGNTSIQSSYRLQHKQQHHESYITHCISPSPVPRGLTRRRGLSCVALAEQEAEAGLAPSNGASHLAYLLNSEIVNAAIIKAPMNASTPANNLHHPIG